MCKKKRGPSDPMLDPSTVTLAFLKQSLPVSSAPLPLLVLCIFHSPVGVSQVRLHARPISHRTALRLAQERGQTATV